MTMPFSCMSPRVPLRFNHINLPLAYAVARQMGVTKDTGQADWQPLTHTMGRVPALGVYLGSHEGVAFAWARERRVCYLSVCACPAARNQQKIFFIALSVFPFPVCC